MKDGEGGTHIIAMLDGEGGMHFNSYRRRGRMGAGMPFNSYEGGGRGI